MENDNTSRIAFQDMIQPSVSEFDTFLGALQQAASDEAARSALTSQFTELTITENLQHACTKKGRSQTSTKQHKNQQHYGSTNLTVSMYFTY